MGVKDVRNREGDGGVAKFRGSSSELTEQILRCAFSVHSRLGPGLLESAYKQCLAHRLRCEGMKVESEVPIDIAFDGVVINTAYRADLIVEETVLLELKATERLLAIHGAQTRTYLKHSAAGVALLINFNVRSLTDGIRRFQK
jgi:GxxExxY protein